MDGRCTGVGAGERTYKRKTLSVTASSTGRCPRTLRGVSSETAQSRVTFVPGPRRGVSFGSRWSSAPPGFPETTPGPRRADALHPTETAGEVTVLGCPRSPCLLRVRVDRRRRSFYPLPKPHRDRVFLGPPGPRPTRTDAPVQWSLWNTWDGIQTDVTSSTRRSNVRKDISRIFCSLPQTAVSGVGSGAAGLVAVHRSPPSPHVSRTTRESSCSWVTTEAGRDRRCENGRFTLGERLDPDGLVPPGTATGSTTGTRDGSTLGGCSTPRHHLLPRGYRDSRGSEHLVRTRGTGTGSPRAAGRFLLPHPHGPSLPSVLLGGRGRWGVKSERRVLGEGSHTKPLSHRRPDPSLTRPHTGVRVRPRPSRRTRLLSTFVILSSPHRSGDF